NAGVDQLLEKVLTLRDRQRVRLARRSKNGESARALAEKPAAVVGEARRVNAQIGMERRHCGNEHTAWVSIETHVVLPSFDPAASGECPHRRCRDAIEV